MTYAPNRTRIHPHRSLPVKVLAVLVLPVSMLMIAAGFTFLASGLFILVTETARVPAVIALSAGAWVAAFSGGALLTWAMNTLSMHDE